MQCYRDIGIGSFGWTKFAIQNVHIPVPQILDAVFALIVVPPGIVRPPLVYRYEVWRMRVAVQQKVHVFKQ
jgi:hypothetical protein